MMISIEIKIMNFHRVNYKKILIKNQNHPNILKVVRKIKQKLIEKDQQNHILLMINNLLKMKKIYNNKQVILIKVENKIL